MLFSSATCLLTMFFKYIYFKCFVKSFYQWHGTTLVTPIKINQRMSGMSTLVGGGGPHRYGTEGLTAANILMSAKLCSKTSCHIN